MHKLFKTEYKHVYSVPVPNFKKQSYLYPLAYNGLILMSIWRLLSVNLF